MTTIRKRLALATLAALLSACSHLPAAPVPPAGFDLCAWLESQRGKTPEAADWPNVAIATTELQ